VLRVLAREAEALNRRAPDPFLPLLRAALHHERAKTLQMLGRHAEAVAEFTAALAHTPTSAHATFRRAFSEKALRLYLAAGDDYETAAALQPGDERLAVNYAGLTQVHTIVLTAAGEEPHVDVAGALAAVNDVARSHLTGHGFGGQGVGFEPIDGLVDDSAAPIGGR
jgi:tetratricopeptide (TPR) repeat protein